MLCRGRSACDPRELTEGQRHIIKNVGACSPSGPLRENRPREVVNKVESGQRFLHLSDGVRVDVVVARVGAECSAGYHEGRNITLIFRLSDGNEANAGIFCEGSELCVFLRGQESPSRGKGHCYLFVHQRSFLFAWCSAHASWSMFPPSSRRPWRLAYCQSA